MISGAAALAELVRTAGETAEPGVHRVLPVAPELSGLLPGRGLRRGSTVAVATGRAAPASGGTSLLLALLSEASRSGSWCAVVGVPALGALAAAESGIALDRLALVPNPGPEWATVVAALIDGVDVVVAAVPGTVAPSIASRLVARARQRGCVLVPFGQWDGADVTLRVTEGRWEGLGDGQGRLRRREVTVLARGRGAAARPKEITMWMPGVTIRPFTFPPTPTTADGTPTHADRPPTAAPAPALPQHSPAATAAVPTIAAVAATVPAAADAAAPAPAAAAPVVVTAATPAVVAADASAVPAAVAVPAGAAAAAAASAIRAGAGSATRSRRRGRLIAGAASRPIGGAASRQDAEIPARRLAAVASRSADDPGSRSGTVQGASA